MDQADGDRAASDESLPPGRWTRARDGRTPDDLTDEQRRQIEELHAIGYLAGVYEAGEQSGVTRYDPERAANGWNLFTSAHRAVSQLIDMHGSVRHQWEYPFSEAWPDDYPEPDRDSTFWRRTHLYSNGDLLAVYEGLGILKVDRHSNLLWKLGVRAHHDLSVMADGTIWVLTREARVIPKIHRRRPVLEDFISRLSPQGEELQRFSFLEALAGTRWEQDWGRRVDESGHLTHLNSLEVLDGSIADRVSEFAAGNFLVSSPLLDMVAVVDATSLKVVWAKTGPFRSQHDPQILLNGRMLIFDNMGLGETSRILEIDPSTWKVEWSFSGSEAEPFYTGSCGLAQRLPGGNTLITETDHGRALEVTSEGDVVWEFYNPHRAGPDDRYIATVMEMWRLPRDFPLDWVQGARQSAGRRDASSH